MLQPTLGVAFCRSGCPARRSSSAALTSSPSSFCSTTREVCKVMMTCPFADDVDSIVHVCMQIKDMHKLFEKY